INSSFVGITHTDILLSWLEMRGPWRSLASRSSLAPSHASLVTTASRNCASFSPIPAVDTKASSPPNTLAEDAQQTLRQLGERGDIIKRIHRGLSQHGWVRGTWSFVLSGDGGATPVIGRLVTRGLDDELKGSAYAVIDGIDGRVHHVRFADLDATA